jgi:hypothetical protein
VSRSGRLTSSPAEPPTSTPPVAHVLPAAYPFAATLPILADLGYQGAGQGVHTPVKQPPDGSELYIDNRTYNALLRALRCLGERGFALLIERWTTLQHITLSPGRIGRPRPRRSRTHPFRIRPDQLKLGEKTSMRQVTFDETRTPKGIRWPGLREPAGLGGIRSSLNAMPAGRWLS